MQFHERICLTCEQSKLLAVSESCKAAFLKKIKASISFISGQVCFFFFWMWRGFCATEYGFGEHMLLFVSSLYVIPQMQFVGLLDLVQYGLYVWPMTVYGPWNWDNFSAHPRDYAGIAWTFSRVTYWVSSSYLYGCQLPLP